MVMPPPINESDTAHAELTEIQCESCGAVVSVEKGRLTARCLFCDAPSVISRPAGEKGRPVFALGFSVEREEAARAVQRWISRQKMAPFGLKRAAAERVTGVYLPAYLYSATAQSDYQASIAEKYETLGIKDKSDHGVTVGSREETEYRDLAGRRVAYVADILVTASRNVTNEELAAIEPFDLGRLRRYSPGLVAGWIAEEPSIGREECLRLARAEVESAIPGALRSFMPGDGVRLLRHATQFIEESLDAILVPVWVFGIRYHPRKPPLRIVVNGQTGTVKGNVPFSLGKVAAWAGAVLCLLILARLGLSLL